MPDYINPSMSSGNKRHTSLNKPAASRLFKYVWPFVPPDTKGWRELNIYETKNCRTKVCELNRKIASE